MIAAIISKAESDCKSGFSIGGHLLSNLSYADDIAAINQSPKDLQAVLDCIVKYSAEVGLFLNISKTECMSTDQNSPLILTIDGKQIKQVSLFAYLGHNLSCTNDGTALKHRIGLGWTAFKKNKVFLTSKRVLYAIKAKVYKIYVRPVVLYGLECVNWTEKLEQQIETFQNHIMRLMTNKRLTDHTKIEEQLRITTLNPIMSTIKSKVLKLYRHVERSEVGLSRQCLEGMVEGKRNQKTLAWQRLQMVKNDPQSAQPLPPKTVICGKTFLMLVRNLPLAEEATNDEDIFGENGQNWVIFGAQMTS